MLNCSASLMIQQAFSRPCLVNLTSKNTNLVFSIYKETRGADEKVVTGKKRIKNALHICDKYYFVINLFKYSGRVIKNQFPYLSTKTYVVGTERNHLSETVPLRNQNIS